MVAGERTRRPPAADPMTLPLADNHTTILAVDDDLAILNLLHHVLHDAGYRVLVASGGWDAIREF